MTPHDFVAKWSDVTLSERSACQSHFLDLCRLLGQPEPVAADRVGASSPCGDATEVNASPQRPRLVRYALDTGMELVYELMYSNVRRRIAQGTSGGW